MSIRKVSCGACTDPVRVLPAIRLPAAYIGALLGLVLLVVLLLNASFSAIVRLFAYAGPALLWLIPYRAVFYLLYAMGWLVILRPADIGRVARLPYLLWVTMVRDAVDRLLPVASVGGSVVGVRLLRMRGLATAAVGASVIVEIVLTLIAAYLFSGLGLILLFEVISGQQYHRLVLFFVLSLPIPVLLVLLLRHGSVFRRLDRFLGRLVGIQALSDGATSLDRELRASFRRRWRLSIAGALQCLALISGSFEVWFALRLFGHPVDPGAALVLESMTQAARHLAFMIPAGLGAQEAGLVLFGHALGINGELALTLSMVKRMREILWGLPALVSWQVVEGWRLHKGAKQSA